MKISFRHLNKFWRNNCSHRQKRKRKREKAQESGGNPLKKCRARWGVDQTDLWCKPCKPEEALDAGGDPVPGNGSDLPLYHVPPLTSGPGPVPSSLGSVQDSLVNTSEPLLDLRSYAGPGPMQPPPPDIAVDASQHSPKYICL